jgi:CBS domain-containing membrane protein
LASRGPLPGSHLWWPPGAKSHCGCINLIDGLELHQGEGGKVLMRWLKRLVSWPPEPTPVGLPEKLRAALAAGLAIFLTGLISSQFIEGGGLQTLVASMGASAVILFAVSHSPMAQPWPLVGGHLLSGLIGVVCARLIPDIWPAAAISVGLAIFLMYLSRCLHPPGGASALIPVLGGEGVKSLGFQFLLTPLALNVAMMLVLALILNRLSKTPAHAGAVKSAHASQTDPPPLERLGIRTEDLRAALRDLNAFVDVSEGELNEIYNLAASRAYRREYGELTCARIMSRELVTAEFGDDLEATWALMQREGVKAIPVIDRGRHVIGIITLTDFFRHARAERFDGLGKKLRQLIQSTPAVTSDKPEVAGQIMTAPVVTAREDAHIAELAPLLSGRGVHQIPIVDEHNKLVGLVTQSDLIAALYRAQSSIGFAETGCALSGNNTSQTP